MDINPSTEKIARIIGHSEDYRAGAVTLRRFVMLETLVVLGLSLILAFVIMTHHSHDRYFAVVGNNRAMPMVSMPYPNMGREAVSDWVASSISQVMTFGFNDAGKRFGESRHLFTPAGWKSFYKALLRSNLVQGVIQNQQIVTSVPQSVPVLRQEGLINGRFSWTFEMPLLMTFRAGANKKTTLAHVQVVVQRVSPQKNPRALAISSWVIG